jgi:hypothetical protein
LEKLWAISAIPLLSVLTMTRSTTFVSSSVRNTLHKRGLPEKSRRFFPGTRSDAPFIGKSAVMDGGGVNNIFLFFFRYAFLRGVSWQLLPLSRARN